jgi:hypothetical protein
MSFATVFFGTQHKQPSIIKKGYVMHGVVLNQLNKAICDPTCSNHEDLMRAVITLAVLEAAVPTGPGNYFKHGRAVEGLLRLLDIGSPVSANSSKLYLSVRHMVLFSALRLREPSILATPDWKKLLRSLCSVDDMQKQDLFNILADCTVLLAKHTTLLMNWQTLLEKPLEQWNTLKREALELLTQLCLWRERWDSDESNSYVEMPMQTPRPNDSLPFTTVFSFPDNSAAIMFIFYNVTLIYVLQILQCLDFEVLDRHSGSDFSAQHILQDPALNEARDDTDDQYLNTQWQAILEICRSIPYHLDQAALAGNVLSPIPPWALAAVSVKLHGNESAVARWVMELLAEKNPSLGRVILALSS